MSWHGEWAVFFSFSFLFVSDLLREIQRNLAARRASDHRCRPVLPRGKRALECVLYTFTELLSLRRWIICVSHGPTTFHDPLLETLSRPTYATLHDAQAEHGRAVCRVLLLVSYQFERHRPWPGYGYERESSRFEDRLWTRVLRLRRGVEDRIVRSPLLTAVRRNNQKKKKHTRHAGNTENKVFFIFGKIEIESEEMLGSQREKNISRTLEPMGAPHLRGRSSNQRRD